MTLNINESACPFCQQHNRCAVANKQGCWCANITIPFVGILLRVSSFIGKQNDAKYK